MTKISQSKRYRTGKTSNGMIFFKAPIADAVGAMLEVRQITGTRKPHPPYLQFRLHGPSRPWCRWTHSLRDCGDDMVCLLAQIFGYDTGDYAYSGIESVRGVQKGDRVILSFGDIDFTCAIKATDAFELLQVLARLFEWDLTEDES